MDHQTTYLSFWDIEMSNLPVGTFRRRALSAAEARTMVSSARASGTLVCVAKDDLGAPYCEREREKHRDLCAALRDHADIDIGLKDFLGDDCANPLCLAEIGARRSLLVVDCHYSFVDEDRLDTRATDIPDLDEVSKAQAVRLMKGPVKMSIVPDSIQIYVFEMIEAVAGAHPAYEPDDGPLSSPQVAAVRRAAASSLPKGALVSKRSLF